MSKIYTIGEINQYIKAMFAQDFLLNRISIQGEVSNCKYHTSGHIYFSLKDQTATIRAVMFKGKRKAGLAFPMKDGDQVVVTGAVEVYERDGQYQIYASRIERAGTGDLRRQLEELKKRLEEMGMFAPEYKQPIPKYARTVGIVTAPTGAALQDIRRIAMQRNPGVQLVLYPALVQGEGAAESIVKGIRALERYGVDVMIVGRGGGSIEDLWAFNEEIVARAIFDCRVPIISAVGHEIDWMIADYVADQRAPTPTAAAELAVFELAGAEELLAQKKARAMRLMNQQLRLAKEQLEGKRKRLFLLSPKNRLNENRHRSMEYQDKLEAVMTRLLQKKQHQFELLAGRLEAASPVKKLSGGYAFVEDANGKGLVSAAQASPDDELCVHLLDGSVRARVTEVRKNG